MNTPESITISMDDNIDEEDRKRDREEKEYEDHLTDLAQNGL